MSKRAGGSSIEEVDLRRTRETSARGGEERGKEETWRGRAPFTAVRGDAEGRVGVEIIERDTDARRPELSTFEGGPTKSISSASTSATVSTLLEAALNLSCISPVDSRTPDRPVSSRLRRGRSGDEMDARRSCSPILALRPRAWRNPGRRWFVSSSSSVSRELESAFAACA